MQEAWHTIRGGAVTPLEALDARGVLRHLRRGWLVLLACAGLSAVCAVAAVRAVPAHYTGSLVMLVDPAGPSVVERDMVDRRPRWDSGVVQVETLARIARSDEVLGCVVRRLDLGRDPEFGGAGWADALSAWLGDAPDRGRDPAAAADRRALEWLRRAVAVRKPEDSLTLNVYVETRDAEKSARIANAVAEAFVEAQAADRAGTARRLAGALDDGLPGLKAAVAEAEGRVLRYRREHRLASADGTPLGEQRLETLTEDLVAAEIRTREARARLDQARGADDAAALPEMLGSRELRALRQRYAAVSGELAELRARLGARHPALAEFGAQERDLTASIAAERARIAESLARDHERAAAGEAALRAGREAAESEVRGDDRAGPGLRELERDLAARRAVYEASLRRTGEVGALAEIDGARIRVITPAKPDPVPTWPAAGAAVALQALALGLIVGVGVALRRGVRAEGRRFAAMTGRVPAGAPGGSA